MENANSTEQKKNLMLRNGAAVTLHYPTDGPSLEKSMISILCSHLKNQPRF